MVIRMKQDTPELNVYPPKVVGSVTTLEDWSEVCRVDVSGQCDWIEMRLDTFPRHITAKELMEKRPFLPVIVTARSSEEGGKRAMDAQERMKLLEEFLPYAHAVDIEIAHMDAATDLIGKARRAGVVVVASAHDFDKTPDAGSFSKLEQAARSKGADIVKLAFMLNEAQDMMTGVSLLKDRKGPMAVMGMGALGQTSRLLYSQLGSCLIYGYLGNYAAAHGQWPARIFKDLLGNLQPMR